MACQDAQLAGRCEEEWEGAWTFTRILICCGPDCCSTQMPTFPSSKMPKKAQPQPGAKALATLDVVSPTVNGCLAELTAEVQELLEWAEKDQADANVWGLNPTLLMAIALRLRNPARPERALKESSAVAATESNLAPASAAVSALVEGAIRDVTTREGVFAGDPPPPAEPSVMLTAAEAAAAAKQLLAGGVVAAGLQLPLLYVEGSDLVVVQPMSPPPPATKEDVARNAELAHARARIACAHPRVIGTGLPPAPVAPIAGKTTRVPLSANAASKLAAWLEGAKPDSFGKAGPAFAQAVRTAFVARSFVSPAYPPALLAADPSGVLELSQFVERSVTHGQLIARELMRRGEALEALVGVGPCALSYGHIVDVIRGASGLSSLSLAPLPSSTTPEIASRRNAAPEWRALAEIIGSGGAKGLASLSTGISATTSTTSASTSASVSASTTHH